MLGESSVSSSDAGARNGNGGLESPRGRAPTRHERRWPRAVAWDMGGVLFVCNGRMTTMWMGGIGEWREGKKCFFVV